MNRSIIIWSLILIISGIILGAFGAHSLKEIISQDKLLSFETGIRYQIYQGLGMLIIGFSSEKINFSIKWFILLGLIGTFLFCFSIYILALSNQINIPTHLIGPITPIGGTMIICSWGVLLKGFLNYKIG